MQIVDGREDIPSDDDRRRIDFVFLRTTKIVETAKEIITRTHVVIRIDGQSNQESNLRSEIFSAAVRFRMTEIFRHVIVYRTNDGQDVITMRGRLIIDIGHCPRRQTNNHCIRLQSQSLRNSASLSNRSTYENDVVRSNLSAEFKVHISCNIQGDTRQILVVGDRASQDDLRQTNVEKCENQAEALF